MKLFFLILLYSYAFSAYGQEKYTIVIMGSSTAEGRGASIIDSSYVERYRKYLKDQNVIDTLINLARGGYTSYHLMPDGFDSDKTSIAVDPDKNITKALSYNPDAIIINLPSNDVDKNIPKEEFFYNIDSMKSMAERAGALCYITTTQPRNLSTAKRNILIEVKDTIKEKYKEFSIDFWSGLASEEGRIKAGFDFGDGIHLNNAGHKILAERTIAKGIVESLMALPVVLVSFAGTFRPGLGIEIRWQTTSEINNDFFTIERSVDNASFVAIQTMAGSGSSSRPIAYAYTDDFQSYGAVFYRLRQDDLDGKFTYSKTIKVTLPTRSSITVFPNPAKGVVHLDLEYPVTISLLNSAGIELKTWSSFFQKTLDLRSLGSGIFILQVVTGDKMETFRLVLQ